MQRRRSSGLIAQIAAAIAVVAALLLLTACEIDIGTETLDGSGIAKTSKRETPDFNRIDLKGGSIEVKIAAGRPRSVTVRGDDNLVGEIRTEVKGETLKISNRHPFKSDLGITVEIGVPTLTGVEISGSGTVTVDEIDNDSFGVDLSGSGDLTINGTAKQLGLDVSGSGDVSIDGLAAQKVNADISGSGSIEATGTTDRLDLDISGSGRIQLDSLVSRDARVDVSGSGDVRIHVTDTLSIEISGSGDVVYGGNPADVTREVTGSGSISPR